MLNKKEPNATDVKVGKRVRMRRLMLGMSQEKLADRLNLTFQQVQKYEKGTNRIGSSRLQQIADILQTPVAWFFGENEVADPAGADIVTQMLTTPHGLDLAKSFLATKRPSDRIVIAKVADSLATAGSAT